MNIRYEDRLAFVTTVLEYRAEQLVMSRVLLDTGSSGTIFSDAKLEVIGLVQDADDVERRIRGIGGYETVFEKRIDKLSLGHLSVENFDIEVGPMNYGFEINGILGLDFLMQVGAVIDLSKMTVG